MTIATDMSYRGPEEVDIFMTPGSGFERWLKPEAAQDLPDRLPYGLDRVADSPDRTQLRTAPHFRPGWRRPRSARTRSQSAPVGLAWDETTLAAAIQADLPVSLMMGGVIWATDHLRTARDRVRNSRLRSHLRAADGVWCLSRPQVEAVRDWLGSDGPPVHFLRFGVDSAFFSDAPIPDGPPLVLSVGGDRDRDWAVAFEAMARLRESIPDARCVAVTKSTITPPPGIERVARLPHLELRDMYRAASLVLIATQPNIHVSGMTVSLEAQASGRPVVATGSPGFADYVAHGSTGMLTYTRDPQDLAAHAVTLLRDRELLESMGANARARVLSEHSTSVMAQRLRGIISTEFSRKYGVRGR